VVKKELKSMYIILIYMEDKFVNIKIRKEFRDMIKEYSKDHGYKMYALIEELIKEKCTKKILYSNRT
tara:strand:- start:204 stop:404 length:201 start_codon:yes stop_codon:yes gene_type:complete